MVNINSNPTANHIYLTDKTRQMGVGVGVSERLEAPTLNLSQLLKNGHTATFP